MWVYIDDSGDGGFKFGRGSTSHLVMAACVFRTEEDVAATAEMINGCAAKNRRQNEFKFSKSKDSHRSCFFECCRAGRFAVRAVVIDKQLIHSPHLRTNPSALKSWAVMQMLTHTFGTVRDAKVFVDGQDTSAFGITDQRYLRDNVNRAAPGTVREVTFSDSRSNRMIQLADMTAGAINLAFRTHAEKEPKFFEMFRPKTWQPRGSRWHLR